MDFKIGYKTKIAFIATSAVVTGVAGVYCAPVVISYFGFSPSGVLAYSSAASLHSSIGNVATGSVFASLQSAGATTALAASTKWMIGMGTGLVGALLAHEVTSSNAAISFGNSTMAKVPFEKSDHGQNQNKNKMDESWNKMFVGEELFQSIRMKEPFTNYYIPSAATNFDYLYF